MATQPTLTILKSGMLSISASAFDLLESPDAVELMFDTTRRVIGIRAIDASEPHAYPTRIVGGRGGAGTYVVSGTAFLKFFGIQPPVSTRWAASVTAGVLTVDLAGEGVPVTSNRATKRLSTRPGQADG